MAEDPQLTEAERAEIGNHAQRLAAYVTLRNLVRKWRAELELQDRANYVVARVLGAMVAAAAVGVASYTVYQAYDLVVASTSTPIVTARKVSWYLAALALTFSIFSFGAFYALWSMPRRWYVAAVAALPIAGFLFVIGLLVAPFIVWLIAS